MKETIKQQNIEKQICACRRYIALPPLRPSSARESASPLLRFTHSRRTQQHVSRDGVKLAPDERRVFKIQNCKQSLTPMKMKRSKIDVINATVESYLKRRRYQVRFVSGIFSARRTVDAILHTRTDDGSSNHNPHVSGDDMDTVRVSSSLTFLAILRTSKSHGTS